jgi:hypothetical protein
MAESEDRNAARQARHADVARAVAAKLTGVRARLSESDFDSLVRRIAELIARDEAGDGPGH